LTGEPKAIAGAPGLFATNIDPVAAAAAYRERVVGPYRGVLPASAVASMEEQLSGACTVEIAAFDEFTKLAGDPAATAEFDTLIFDTAPTGHTLRLLSLPAAWTGFIDSNTTGTSCLGPLAGLQAQRDLYDASLRELSDPSRTTVVLVTRPDQAALREAERTRGELAAAGMSNQALIINGVFHAADANDAVAAALERRGESALAGMPASLAELPRLSIPLLACAPMGIERLGTLLDGTGTEAATASEPVRRQPAPRLAELVADIERSGKGVILAMGKGGVGKTTIAAAMAVELARRGHSVHLTTTDPAAHVAAAVTTPVRGLRVSRIDPAVETRRYTEEVLAKASPHLDAQGLALLAEDLRSPCTEEIAVFRAFADAVAEGGSQFVVIDTAPTGHTLLLLDAAESYHREVSRTTSDIPEAVRRLLPRLRDAEFTRILLVTLAEATPVHEAARLQDDLQRAGIEPYAWIVNQSFHASESSDPLLRERGAQEAPFIEEVRMQRCKRVAVVPWAAECEQGPVPRDLKG
ncbi:MAG: arsenical pump-driving ATPase, partial [Acidobacteria bacterium]|nr:arsenical pump-driving ATPase [Acidobacteriota bacterium]